jgi:RimJ/RimL family protein N-acetyltransferase
MLRLDKFDRSCYDLLISWVDNAEALMQFAGPAFSFPLTTDQLDNSLSDPKRFAFQVVDQTNDSGIGHAEIYLANDSAYLGRILIGDPANRGKGLGQEIVSKLVHFAFTDLKQTKVQLNVFEWNTVAIRCYEKVGFYIIPDKKFERVINGQTWKGVMMALDSRRLEEVKQDLESLQ